MDNYIYSINRNKYEELFTNFLAKTVLTPMVSTRTTQENLLRTKRFPSVPIIGVMTKRLDSFRTSSSSPWVLKSNGTSTRFAVLIPILT